MKNVVRLTESDLTRIVNKIISEQDNPYKEGEMYTGVRSTDKQKYNIKIMAIFGSNSVLAEVQGPGFYGKRDLRDAGFGGQFDIVKPGVLKGGGQWGTFTDVKKSK